MYLFVLCSLKMFILKSLSKDNKKLMFTALCRSLATFGRSWAALGSLLVAFGRSCAALGPLLAALGRLLAALGPLLAALGTTFENHPKIDAKNDRFGPPKASQNDTKSYQKTQMLGTFGTLNLQTILQEPTFSVTIFR